MPARDSRAARAPDIDALLAKYPVKVNPHRVCTVTRSGQRELIDAMLERGIPASRIAEIIRAEFAFKIADGNIQRHRRGDCQCPKV
jgi:hypothetical protein